MKTLVKLSKLNVRLLLLSGALTLAGCQDSSFVGTSGKKTKPKAEPKPIVENPKPKTEEKPGGDYSGGGDESGRLALNCETAKTLNVNLKSGSTTKVNGEICPRSEGKLSALFLIDTSGSMKEVDKSFLGLNCDRVKATQDVISAIKADMRDRDDDVAVGTIRFATDAEVIRELKSVRTAGFSTALNAPRLCKNEGWTNYRDAFELAKEQFNGVTGRKVIYFITDGEPTYGAPGVAASTTDAGGHHKAAALEKVRELKNYFGNELTINAVFLNSRTGGSERDLLNQITGDAKRVKFADNVDQLTDKLIELSFPAVVLDQNRTYAELSAPGFNPKNIQLRLTPDANRPGVYFYETEAFVPFKGDSSATRNELNIIGIDMNGNRHDAKAVINVTHQ